MLCQKCKTAKATIFLSQIVDGEVHKLDLCEACAKEMGVTDNTGFSIADMLLNFTPLAATAKTAKRELACEFCGYTEQELKKTGRLGCDHCYETFSPLLQEVFQTLHRSTQHKGKTPARQLKKTTSRKKLSELEAALDTAIREEDFEQAARLRDQIRLFKKD